MLLSSSLITDILQAIVAFLAIYEFLKHWIGW
jgi:hypothetical protein